MRPLAWTAIAAASLALSLGLVGRQTQMRGFDIAAGLLWVVAIVAGVMLLPLWRRVIPSVGPMPGLFPRPGVDERWCTGCGSVAPRDGSCVVCGGAGPARRVRKART